MPYPNSTDVNDGQPTSFQQYNRLRKDALFLGNAEINSAPAGAMMSRYSEGLSLEILETDRVRVPASGAAPVGLMIGGVPLQTTVNVDLPLSNRPGGVDKTYYVFAVRTPGLTNFTIAINTSPLETANTRCIGSFWWDGSAISYGSVKTLEQQRLVKMAGGFFPLGAGGRLTLTPGTAVTTADVVSSDTVYYTPYMGGRIPFYARGSGWYAVEFSRRL